MRLNSNSMDKVLLSFTLLSHVRLQTILFQLYDLMVMAVKQQVLMSVNPHDLVMITLNHLDAIRDYARTPAVKNNIELAYELLIQA